MAFSAFSQQPISIIPSAYRVFYRKKHKKYAEKEDVIGRNTETLYWRCCTYRVRKSINNTRSKRKGALAVHFIIGRGIGIEKMA
jgi:hypothetical protein